MRAKEDGRGLSDVSKTVDADIDQAEDSRTFDTALHWDHGRLFRWVDSLMVGRMDGQWVVEL